MSCDGGRRRRQRSDGRDRLDELDVTKEELDGIGEALKTEQFRKLLCEYVDDVTDPENVARYEREMEQYERERGVHVTFVRPRPGYVVKTSADGERKVFVNVCSSDAVAGPTRSAAAGGHRWSLPHCASPVRQDYDRARKPCDVYDVIFHPDVLEMTAAAGADPRFRDMVEDTALTAVERADGVALDRANLKYPKMSFKGLAKSLVLRRRVDGDRRADKDRELPPGYPQPPPPPPADRPMQHHDLGPPRQKSPFAVPKYVIKYRSDIDIQEHGYDMHCKMNAVIPKELIVEINLPLLDSAANVQLDVLPKSLKLVCDRPSKYRLDVGLPYAVLEDDGNATFDRSAKTLTVRLPVSRTEPPLSRHVNAGRHLVSEVDEKRGSLPDGDTNRSFGSDPVACGVDDGDRDGNCVDEGDRNGNRVDDFRGKSMDKASVANGHSHDANGPNQSEDDVTSNVLLLRSNGSEIIDENGDSDVHYSLPEHELIVRDKTCVLALNVKNVDPTSINMTVENRENLISGKLQSVGSGFFPVWFAFCLRMTSETGLSDVRVSPTDERVVVEFSGKPERERYWFGLYRHALTVRYFETETLKENSKSLANGVVVSVERNDSDDDVFDDGKREIDSKRCQHDDAKKNNNNGKTLKEKRRKKNKFQKSNSVPIAMNGGGGLSESNKSVDFVPAGSLPIEFNDAKPTIRGILKKRSLSECSSADDVVWSSRTYGSSVDNVDTESSDVQELSFNDSKKSVRFNDHVVEKKINFNISIAAQAKKHRQRQQRKRNIREYNTPSESEASEAEDRTFGPLNVVSESEETSVSESSAGEMSDDNGCETTAKSSKVTVVADSKKDHKRRKSKSARKNASLAKQTSTNNLIFPIDY